MKFFLILIFAILSVPVYASLPECISTDITTVDGVVSFYGEGYLAIAGTRQYACRFAVTAFDGYRYIVTREIRSDNDHSLCTLVRDAYSNRETLIANYCWINDSDTRLLSVKIYDSYK